MIYEICVDSAAGVRAAKSAGANRVELCAPICLREASPRAAA